MPWFTIRWSPLLYGMVVATAYVMGPGTSAYGQHCGSSARVMSWEEDRIRLLFPTPSRNGSGSALQDVSASIWGDVDVDVEVEVRVGVGVPTAPPAPPARKRCAGAFCPEQPAAPSAPDAPIHPNQWDQEGWLIPTTPSFAMGPWFWFVRDDVRPDDILVNGIERPPKSH